MDRERWTYLHPGHWLLIIACPFLSIYLLITKVCFILRFFVLLLNLRKKTWEPLALFLSARNLRGWQRNSSLYAPRSYSVVHLSLLRMRNNGEVRLCSTLWCEIGFSLHISPEIVPKGLHVGALHMSAINLEGACRFLEQKKRVT